jgi:hypothetical protein
MQNGLRWREASDVIPKFPSFAWKVQVEASLRDALRERILARFLHIGDAQYEITGCWATVLAPGRHTSCTATPTTF